jgi:valyl-tRNA synthetase
MKVGRRLAIKILNASKFALGVMGDVAPSPDAITVPLDRSMLAALHEVVDVATCAFDDFDYARALEHTERFFWGFCDDYVELVKQRAYGTLGEEAASSARAALALALSTLLRLFAPHLPFVTEEVWSWWQEGSVHRAAWPTVEELGPSRDDTSVYDIAAEVLGEIRKAKSSAQRSMRTEVTRVVVNLPPALSQPLELAVDDLREAGRVTGDIELEPADELSVEADLAEPDAA